MLVKKIDKKALDQERWASTVAYDAYARPERSTIQASAQSLKAAVRGWMKAGHVSHAKTLQEEIIAARARMTERAMLSWIAQRLENWALLLSEINKDAPRHRYSIPKTEPLLAAGARELAAEDTLEEAADAYENAADVWRAARQPNKAKAALRMSRILRSAPRQDPMGASRRDAKSFQKYNTKELRSALEWAEGAVIRARRSGIEVPAVHFRFIEEAKAEIRKRTTANDPDSRRGGPRHA